MDKAVKPMNEKTPVNLARAAKERSNLYGFLASVYRDIPSAGFLRQVLSPDFLEAISKAGISLDRAALKSPEEDDLLDILEAEFTALFIGPGAHVSPHESVHRSPGSGILWGPETIEVKKFIETSGFAYDSNFHDLPDHISVELEFMAHLTRLEAKAWRLDGNDEAMNCQRFQKEFLDRHLARWVSTFSVKVSELAEKPFYPQMAMLTSGFVEAEIQELSKIDSFKAPAN